MVSKKDKKKFEKLLMDEAQRLGGSIKSIEEASRFESGRESGGDLSSYAESGTDNFELETALNIASGESNWLNEIADALKRLEKGSYGVCESCEEQIPRKRLEVFPSARYCVQCQSEFEKQNVRY